MKEGVRNGMVGLFSIAAMLGFAALLMSFGELDPLFNPRYTITLFTDHAGGLRPGGTVEFNGVPVGVIDAVSLDDQTVHPVRITCLISQHARIPSDAVASTYVPLIGGSAVLKFDAPRTAPDDGSSIEFLPTDDRAEVSVSLGGGMFAQLSEQIDQKMQPLMDSLQRFNALADTYIAVGANLNDLMKPQDVSQLAAGQAPNLRTAVVKLNTALDEAQAGLALAKEFLGDQQLRANVTESVANAKKLIDQASGAVERYTALADSLQANSDDIARRIVPVTDALATTLDDVRRLTRLASEGQGTVGRLLNNADLYHSLNDAAVRLQQALKQAQLLIEKLKSEGVSVKF